MCHAKLALPTSTKAVMSLKSTMRRAIIFAALAGLNPPRRGVQPFYLGPFHRKSNATAKNTHDDAALNQDLNTIEIRRNRKSSLKDQGP